MRRACRVPDVSPHITMHSRQAIAGQRLARLTERQPSPTVHHWTRS
jgi:hypothetical protein